MKKPTAAPRATPASKRATAKKAAMGSADAGRKAPTAFARGAGFEPTWPKPKQPVHAIQVVPVKIAKKALGKPRPAPLPIAQASAPKVAKKQDAELVPVFSGWDPNPSEADIKQLARAYAKRREGAID